MHTDESNCYLPTHDQIEAACAVIRASWSDKTRAKRRECGPDKVIYGGVSKELASQIDLAMRAAASAE